MAPRLGIELDRSSPVPLYFQVAEQIAEAIRSGELASGARLENEILLAEQLGLSRPTVRQAIQYLVDKGMLIRKRGVGTQVVHSQVNRSMELSSLYDDLARAGKRPVTSVITLENGPCPDEAAAALGVAAGDEVVIMERLRFADDEPLAIMHNWLPTGLADFSAADLEKRGLYEILRQAGFAMKVATQRIGARAATAAEARRLDERRGAPLLTMVRTTYDDGGRAIEHGSHVYRATLYSLDVTLVDR